MLRYKLNQLVSKPKGTKIPLPEIHGSLVAEQQYLRIEREMLKGIARKVNEEVLPAAVAEIEATKLANRLQTDVDGDIFTRLRQYAALLAQAASNMVNKILDLEGQKHTKQFAASAKKALGIDLSAIINNADLSQLMQTAATRNAGLIKGLADDAVTRVSTAVTNAVMAGKSAKELKQELVKQFGFSDSRAKLIARDQTAKFNSDLNRFRQQQAGIEKYTWRTSADERVRPRHRALEGNVYAYGEPTGAEDGLPPGQPVQCRCVAQAIVDFGEAPKTIVLEPETAKKTAKTPEQIAVSNAKTAAEVAATKAKFEVPAPKPAPPKVAMPEWKLPAQFQQAQANPAPPVVAPPVANPLKVSQVQNQQMIAKLVVEGQAIKAQKQAAKLAAKVQAGISKGEAFAKKQAQIEANKALYAAKQAMTPEQKAAAKAAENAKIAAVHAASKAQIERARGPAAPAPLSPKAIAARPFNPTSKGYGQIAKDITVVPTAGEKEAAKFYTGPGFRAINGYLRGTSSASPLVKRLTKDLGTLVERTTLTEDVLGYRGVGNLSDIAKVSNISQLIGAEIQDKAFVSVTTDPKIARGFAAGNNKNENPPPYGVMLEVRMAKGQKALPAKDFSKHSSEQELILTAGSRFKVVDAVRNGITMENRQYDKLVVEYIE